MYFGGSPKATLSLSSPSVDQHTFMYRPAELSSDEPASGGEPAAPLSVDELARQNSLLLEQNVLITQINDQLTREKTQLQIEAELHRRETDQLRQRQARDESLVAELQGQLDALRRAIAQKDYELERMASKLLDYKARIDDVELQLRRFMVKKVNSFFPNRDVDLVITKNPSNGVISLHIEVEGKRDTWLLSSIKDVGKITPCRFVIEFGSPKASQETFESDQVDLIVRFLRDLLSLR